ncbi:MAG TPA: (2Fe-2S)-binding protein [Burkholderiaceae bacterium]|nr:(2Fe-2S)-binding protein [Burkholderiaceae bacterium]
MDTQSTSAPATAHTTIRLLRLSINGVEHEHTAPAHTTLAALLREHAELTGTKVACDQAACGACTVLLDGEPVFACHTLAAQVQGSRVLTIEGIGGDQLDPLQGAFIDRDAMQCGFCTPGMILALKAAVARAAAAGIKPGRAELAQAISGNVCRCGAYPHILDAALDVVGRV